jgi:hypothetical protein
MFCYEQFLNIFGRGSPTEHSYKICLKQKVKYAHQELPHSKDTDSPHSQEEEWKRERAWFIK